MKVIEAASAGVRDMSDGSLRITFEFDPRHAAEAFALFGPRGRSVAIAALKDGHGAASDKPLEPEKPKGGELARLAGMWCSQPEFLQFVRPLYDKKLGGTGDAWGDVGPDDVGGVSQYCAHCVKVFCGIDSRADLDHNPVAAEKFQRLIRGPYMAWLKEQAA